MQKNNPYIEFTQEQIDRANATNLADFLLRQGEKLKRSGNEWRWKRHDSITVNGNRWYRHSQQQGGYPIAFVREFYGKDFPEAVLMLLGDGQGVTYAQSKPQTQKKPAPFELPDRNHTMHRMFAYLMKQRHIAGDVISHFAHERTLYEDAKYHNAVFVGHDEHGKPCHAHKIGTYTEGEPFKGNVESSDPRYCFRHIGESDTLYVFEAPIDMLSYITLHPEDWQRHSYVMLGGVAPHAMLNVLERNPRIQKVRLCLDNDPAGIEATNRLTALLHEKGYADVQPELSVYKDWNEDLAQGCAEENTLSMTMQ
jgi:hypothetical protein